MKSVYLLLPPLLFLAGCMPQRSQPTAPDTSTTTPTDKRTDTTKPVPTPPDKQPERPPTLPEARRNFKPTLKEWRSREPVDAPPKELFRLVRYDAPVGQLAAYLSEPPRDGKRHPAIIWLFDGFNNSIGARAWMPGGRPEDDESASAFRKNGIVMMYPSLRGGNNNPGYQEGCLGEVDDVLAALEYLSKQNFIDRERIYLGGHGTGATLALLTAASTDRFRAVFAFGPVDDIRAYGEDNLPFVVTGERDADLRSPVRWLHSVQCPVLIFEGTDKEGDKPSNLPALQALRKGAHNKYVHTYPVKGATHLSILAPVTRLIAEGIPHDDAAVASFKFTEEELNALFAADE